MDIFDTLINLAGKDNVFVNESMKNHTSFKTGGTADYFVRPKDVDTVVKLISKLNEYKIKYFILGNGSNILVSDRGIEGVVINFGGNFSDIDINRNDIVIKAGALLSSVAQAALNHELAGFEFASGIPGSFGGAIYMNAGAYGSEIKDIIKWARVIDENGKVITLNNNDMALEYRKSIFQYKNYVILDGCIELKKGLKSDIMYNIENLNSKRREKQPLNFPSAGSTFKRPDGYFAGKLIEESGLKGKTIGGAKVSEKHAGFIINANNATTDDILCLIDFCKKTVYEKFGVELKPEVKFVGRD